MISSAAREHFLTFVREYHPINITYRELESPYRTELSQRDFTRYITKSIFLGKGLWRTERLESYQYFNQDEFLAAIDGVGLAVAEQRMLTVDEEKWSRQVQIESRGGRFSGRTHPDHRSEKTGIRGIRHRARYRDRQWIYFRIKPEGFLYSQIFHHRMKLDPLMTLNG